MTTGVPQFASMMQTTPSGSLLPQERVLPIPQVVHLDTGRQSPHLLRDERATGTRVQYPQSCAFLRAPRRVVTGGDALQEAGQEVSRDGSDSASAHGGTVEFGHWAHLV